ncbi:phage tail tape measure protein [Clostridium tyrobutyricum]|uniref:phage tail tape measure protein n=1 Tax=Clostridium tyrobutyricum TaxID=1519 RepID=UPI001C3801E0|nr:phage tail tape measure protein [Clostridium tyrobutyricum]MBV4432244.1 phage tail tape measure protein [Clostridium tyrobutyricum]
MAGEEISSLAVRLALNDSDFSKGMQNLKKNLGIIDSGFKSSIAGVKDWGKNLDNLKNSAQALGEKISAQQKIVQSYTQQLEKSKATMEKSSKKMLDLKSKVEEARKAYEQSVDTLGRTDKQTKELKTTLNDLTKKYQNSERTVANNSKTVQGYTIQMNNANGKLKDFESQLDETNKKITNFKLTSLSDSLKESSNKFKAVGEGANKAGDSILKLSIPLVGAGVAAAKVGMDFETSMSQVAGALNKPVSQMGSLNELALKTGQDTQFSSTQAGQAMTELANGGLNEAKIKAGALDATMNLAASSGMDLGIAANTVVQAMGAFGLSASQASQAVNALAGSAAASSTDVEPLSQGLAQCAAQAHMVGWSIQDTTAVLGAFADAGVVGSDAGTSLKTMLQRLGAPLKDARAEMKLLGINIWDGNGHMKDAAGIAQELQSHMKGLSDSHRQAAMSIIFGSDATRAASILMNNGATGVQKYTKATNDQSVASRLAASQMGDTAKSIEQMKGSLETAGIKLAQNFAPTIKVVADDIGKLADAFGNLSPGTQKLMVDFAEITVVAGGTLKVFGGFAKSTGSILDFLGKFTGKVAESKVASKVAEEGIKKVGLAAAKTGVETAGVTATSGGLIAGLGSVAAVALPVAGAIVGVGAAAYGIHYAVTEKAVPAVDLFNNKFKESTQVMDQYGNKINTTVTKTVDFSESTKKAVSSYMQMDTNVRKTMTDMYVNSNNFSSQTKNAVISQFNEMTNRVSGLTANQKDKTITDFSNMVANTSTLTNQNKTQIIAQYTNMVNRVSGLSNQQKQQVIKSFQDTMTQSTGITKTQANNVITQFNSMGIKIKAGMDKQYTDRYTTMKNFFAKSDALSIQEEQKVLSKMTANNNAQKSKIDSYEKQIAAIELKAVNQHRQVTQQEQQQINTIQDKMRTSAVQSLSSTEIQSKVLLERMKSYGSSITQQQASDIIKNANKQRDGAIAAANSQYNKVVADAVYQRDVSHTMTADQAQKVITNAGKQRDGAIKAAQNQRTQVVSHLSKMDGEVLKNMNTDTGNMLSPWGKLIKGIQDKWTNFKKWLSSLFKNSNSKTGNSTSSVGSGNGFGGIGTPGSIVASANGNIIDRPVFSIAGEDGAEAIIPLSSKRRERGLELWQQAGQMMGVKMFANGGIVGSSNTSNDDVKVNAGLSTSITLGKSDLNKFENYGEELNKYLAQGIENSASIVSKSSDLTQQQMQTLITAFIKKYADNGQDMNKNLGTGIIQSSASVITPINSLNTNLGNMVASFAQSFTNHGQDSMSNLGSGITNNEDTVISANTKVTTDNKKILEDYSKNHTDYGTSSMDNLGTAITGNEDVVTNANSKVTADNKAILSNYVQLHTTYGTTSMNNLTTGINNTSPKVLAATNKISSDNKTVLNGLAASANPTGQNVSNGLSAGMKSAENNAVSIAKELTQKVLDAFTGKDGFDIHSPPKKTTGFGENVIQGFINGMSKQDVLNFFKNKIGGMIGFAKGASGQISGLLTAALGLTGTPMSWLPGLEQLVQRESGGDPLAYNNISVGGEHATGLMQMLGSTFSSYAASGHTNILNPLDNILSAINYIKARYGSVMNIPNLFNGNYVGYESGTTNAVAGWRIVGENGPELEYSPTGGETIFNNSDTMSMLSSSSTINTGKTLGSNLIAGISAGINESKDGLQYTLDTISNLFKYSIATATKQTASTVKTTVKETLNDVDSWLPDFSKALANGIKDNTVYTKNSALKLGTVLADSVMDERNARSQYLDAYNKKKMTADKALADLDGMNKKLEVSTNDDAKDMKNLLGVMTNESTEIVILTAEYNKLGKQYGYNSDKAVEALKKVQDLRAEYQKTGKDVQDLADKIKKNVIDNVNDISSNLKDALKQRYQDEQDAAEKQVNLATDTQTKILQSKLDALSDQESQMDIQYQDEDDEDKRAELERQLSMHYGAAKKKELQQELDDLNKTEERRHAKEALDQQKDDLQTQIDQLKENNDTMIKNIEEFYSNKLEDANLDAETQKMLVNNNQIEIVNLLKSYGKDYELAGSTLGDRLVTGFKGSLTSISNMISNLKSQINNLSTNVDLSSISPLSTNVSNTITSNNIQQAYTIPQNIQSNQPIVINNKIFLDGKQLAANQTQYVNNNLGTVNALNTRGL